MKRCLRSPTQEAPSSPRCVYERAWWVPGLAPPSQTHRHAAAKSTRACRDPEEQAALTTPERKRPLFPSRLLVSAEKSRQPRDAGPLPCCALSRNRGLHSPGQHKQSIRNVSENGFYSAMQISCRYLKCFIR